MKIFAPSEIVEWCCEKKDGDEVTALCPFCGIDSIVGKNANYAGYPITPEFMQLLHKHSFG